MTLLVLRSEMLLLDQRSLCSLVVLVCRVVSQLRDLWASKYWHQVTLHQLTIDEGGWKRGAVYSYTLASRRCRMTHLV